MNHTVLFDTEAIEEIARKYLATTNSCSSVISWAICPFSKGERIQRRLLCAFPCWIMNARKASLYSGYFYRLWHSHLPDTVSQLHQGLV